MSLNLETLNGIAVFFRRKSIFFWLLLLSTSLCHSIATQPSGCQLCASTGQCNTAFHSGPGQYCGQFFDTSKTSDKPCCCPLQSTCNMSPTQCKCHVGGSQPNNVPAPTQAHGTSHYDPLDFSHDMEKYNHSVIPIAVAVALVICCCYLCCRDTKDHEHHHHTTSHYENVPIASAVPEYDSCPPENPSYYPQYASETKPSGGGGGAGTAIASGLGGFAAGAIVGDFVGRMSSRGNNSNVEQQRYEQSGNYQSGGGGYDIAGDSGDADGYDIVGDSGDGDDGGYDIQGDS
ncbi:hypothetical protein ACHAXS_008725 [Conticribra weissflogii]